MINTDIILNNGITIKNDGTWCFGIEYWLNVETHCTGAVILLTSYREWRNSTSKGDLSECSAVTVTAVYHRLKMCPIQCYSVDVSMGSSGLLWKGLEGCSPDTSGPSSLLPTATGASVSSCYHGPNSSRQTFSAMMCTLAPELWAKPHLSYLESPLPHVCHNEMKSNTYQQQ